MQLPADVHTLINRLRQNGYAAHVVGGCVRDGLLGLAPQDWDICTNAAPGEVTRVFAGFHTIGTGLAHGTVTVLVNRTPYEITTYRVDGPYTGHRRPKTVQFTGSLAEDLARRDFTMNAIAYAPGEGYTDPFGGRAAIAAKTIACVGSPNARFEEDALRILRAVRFAASLGFAVQPATKAALLAKRALLQSISAERVNAEFCKLLLGQNAREVLLGYRDVVAVFIPEAAALFGFEQHSPHHRYTVWEHTARAVQAAPAVLPLRLAAFFHDFGKPQTFALAGGTGHFYGHAEAGARLAEQVMRRLRFSGGLTRQVRELVYWHDSPVEAAPKQLRRWLNRLGEEAFFMLLALKRADTLAQGNAEAPARLRRLDEAEALARNLLAENACFALKDLAVNGTDLLAAGVPGGPAVGRWLNRLLEQVLNGALPNTKPALLGWLADALARQAATPP